MTHIAYFATLSAAVAVGFATSASATTIITETHMGVVAAGGDATGAFGPTGADLTGMGFTLTYVFAAENPYGWSYPGYGSVSGYSPSIATASLTIGGRTLTISGTTSDFNHGDYQSSFGMVAATASITNADYFLFSEIGSTDPFIGATMEASYTHAVTDADWATGWTTDSLYFSATGDYLYLYDQMISSDSREVIEAPTVTPTAVPEPTSWAMLMGGLGMVGGALRGRRRRIAIRFG